MKPACRITIAIGLLLCVVTAVNAYSLKGRLAYELHSLSQAFRDYEETHGAFPTDDIYGEDGKPLLSWRVRLLPMDCHLNESWDSPHNRRQGIELYFYPNDYADPGVTSLVGLVGQNTFFGNGNKRGRKEIKNQLSTTVMFVEADREHSVIWTKPEDLAYDSFVPMRGLSKNWTTGFFPERCCYVVMADGCARFLPETTDPAFVRRLFSIENEEPIALSMPWYLVLNRPPFSYLILASLLLSTIFIVSGSIVGYRTLQAKPTSPGEWLCFIVGLQQLAFVVSFSIHYRFELLPYVYPPRGIDQLWLLTLPSFVGTCAALLIWGYVVRGWVASMFFLLLLGAMGVMLLDCLTPDRIWYAEESLTIVGQPFVMAGSALILAFITIFHRDIAYGRGTLHWLGLAMATLPFVWFSVWWVAGFVEPQTLFVHML